MVVIELSDRFDAFHKPRKLLKLCPLIVNGLNRLVHNDMFFDRFQFHFAVPPLVKFFSCGFINDARGNRHARTSVAKLRKAASLELGVEHVESESKFYIPPPCFVGADRSVSRSTPRELKAS